MSTDARGVTANARAAAVSLIVNSSLELSQTADSTPELELSTPLQSKEGNDSIIEWLDLKLPLPTKIPY